MMFDNLLLEQKSFNVRNLPLARAVTASYTVFKITLKLVCEMSNMDPTLELLILGGVVAYVAYTYWKIIGTKTDNELTIAAGQVINITGDARQAKPRTEEIRASGEGFYVFEKHLPGFDTHYFLEGATAAFKIVVEAFSAGDKTALKPLLNAKVLKDFSEAIDARQKRGESLDTKVMHVNKIACEKASIENGVARGTFRIFSSQVNKLHRTDGTVEETPSDTYDSTEDLWVFERQVNASDPNWILVETLSVQ
ncbi:Tim44/TimA family putative adaptor protein [Alphaproteobacteria bacterium]|nr:Tim44/TimA family putative adaptor protein [Alphaproteobacteria bacterium]